MGKPLSIGRGFFLNMIKEQIKGYYKGSLYGNYGMMKYYILDLYFFKFRISPYIKVS